MDFGIGGNLFSLSNDSREQNSNSNNTSFAWDSWKPTTSSSTNCRLIQTLYATAPPETASAAVSSQEEDGLANALMFNLPQVSTIHDDGDHPRQRQHPLYAGDGSLVHPDPHLTCLKLGKRHYFEDANGSSSGGGGDELFFRGKKGKGYYGSSSGGGGSLKTAVVLPRCQVEGCHVALLNAKEYHRRHKVCEMHSKAPKVVVLGLEQRFCQQCSRFHVLSEFDDSKRSCRRRLAGHNERRRKSSHDSVARDSYQDNKLMVGGGIAYASSAECALSLLSAKRDYSWLAPAHDLSSRCSAALRELIAENRAAIMASRQLGFDRDLHFSHHHAVEELKQMQPAADSHYFRQQHQHQM